jgi:DNA-binding HxlR family transcriptional regulator
MPLKLKPSGASARTMPQNFSLGLHKVTITSAPRRKGSPAPKSLLSSSALIVWFATAKIVAAVGDVCNLSGNKNAGSCFAQLANSISSLVCSHIACKLQVISGSVRNVSGSRLKRRSGCPVSRSLETLGDRWSLLIVRDLMVRGFRTFKEFHESGERIATNVLADRLERLAAAGIIMAEREPTDARRVNYRLTKKGIDLAPVLLEMLIWGARHEATGASCAPILGMERNRKQILSEVRRRWRERDSTPLIPRFDRNPALGKKSS